MQQILGLVEGDALGGVKYSMGVVHLRLHANMRNLSRRAGAWFRPQAFSSNALVGKIDHERMPVLLTEENEFETWQLVLPMKP